MKKLLVMLVMAIILAAFFGCNPAPVSDDMTGLQFTQRPQFVETRTEAELEKFIYKGTDLDKGKPQPPVDPGTGTDPNPNPAHKYAYIVGISNYDGTQNDLQYCDDDAVDWKNYLMSQGFTVRIDLDGQATDTAIEAGLTWLRDSAVPGDEIVFSYSGHGNNPNPYGSCLISSNLYYLTNGWIAGFINAANCTKKLVAIDACMAGDFQNLGSVAGTIATTASTGTYSYDGTASMSNGVWTYYFMQSVNSGTAFAEDASAYAITKMKAWGSASHARVSPNYKDGYTGKFDM